MIQCLKKPELANWISPGSVRSYNPARQKRALSFQLGYYWDLVEVCALWMISRTTFLVKFQEDLISSFYVRLLTEIDK